RLDSQLHFLPIVDCDAVHAAIENKVSNVDVLRTHFSSHRLGEPAQTELSGSKGSESLAAADTGRRTGEQHCAAPVTKHAARRFATNQESRVTGQFPHFEEQLVGRLKQRLLDVCAGIEQTDFYRSHVAFDAFAQVLNLSFPTGVHAIRLNAMSCRRQFVDKRPRFCGVAPGNADLVTSRRKTTGDRGPYPISRPN